MPHLWPALPCHEAGENARAPKVKVFYVIGMESSSPSPWGYFRHTDNSSGNGRLLTALVYLNENWKQGDGGELRLFYPGPGMEVSCCYTWNMSQPAVTNLFRLFWVCSLIALATPGTFNIDVPWLLSALPGEKNLKAGARDGENGRKWRNPQKHVDDYDLQGTAVDLNYLRVRIPTLPRLTHARCHIFRIKWWSSQMISSHLAVHTWK